MNEGQFPPSNPTLSSPSRPLIPTTQPLVEPVKLNTCHELERKLSANLAQLEVVGTDSILALAIMICSASQKSTLEKPQLFLFPTSEMALRFQAALEFIEPGQKAHLLPEFDVNLYDGLYPNHRLMSQRIKWMHSAQNPRPGDLFVASLPALIQRTLPFNSLTANSFELNPAEDLPENFIERLNDIGYHSTPLVEDVGQFSFKGGILDLFSPAHDFPVRLELFGDMIESIKSFSPLSQRSSDPIQKVFIIPPREIIFDEIDRQELLTGYNSTIQDRTVLAEEIEEVQHSLLHGVYFSGIDFLLPLFYTKTNSPLEHFSQPIDYWIFDPIEVTRIQDDFFAQLKNDFNEDSDIPIRIPFAQLYDQFSEIPWPEGSRQIQVSRIHIQDGPDPNDFEEDLSHLLAYRSSGLLEFQRNCQELSKQALPFSKYLELKFTEWKTQGYVIFVACGQRNQCLRMKLLLENAGLECQITTEEEYLWSLWREEQENNSKLVHLIPRPLNESVRLPDEKYIFIRPEDFWGTRSKSHKARAATNGPSKRIEALNFGALAPGDLIVHAHHGVGTFLGLKVMSIQNIASEYIQLEYKEGDKLYLPIYHVGLVQKYSGPSSTRLLDKLGGPNWNKVKKKVRKQVEDLASELLKLYALRSEITRPPFSKPDLDFDSFESEFPYDETKDQLSAIADIVADMTGPQPMDRLVCGDVGFGKTEIAMRATFKAVQDGFQVAVIAPTTVLTFQHLETFSKRFNRWPFTIRSLNRFVTRPEAKKTLLELEAGKVDILIGTHRLLSKDIKFKDLGLLIIDEEQKFGVKHKEKIRHIKHNVDTLTLSATPIPRTLNFSLVGLRDLSLINTPPHDRLPTRTFVCRFEKSTVRKAILSEIKRGGQIFFIHNRVQSIYEKAAELRALVPEARIIVGHGQMEETQLEKTMIQFFKHEADLLLCTTIIESGMDIPRANTMFVDRAHQFGLSQLYQLRGRVGRSQARAYCYLLVPNRQKLDKQAQERLRIIQENSALGSGIRISQYDMELRGTGDLLGSEQSGHINAIGYEMYMELLKQALQEQKGEPTQDEDFNPEINLRIPALIPDRYISDIRVRLSYYKTLSKINSAEDIDEIEEELKDQFGPTPEPVQNLFGIMIIRSQCKKLRVKDLIAGPRALTLTLDSATPLPTQRIIELSQRENKKYSIAPDQKLKIRINEITWPRVYEELQYLLSL